MTAGLFAAHGVFFGNTGDGNEFNPRGCFEHPELVSRVECKVSAGWPEAWWKILSAEGWNGSDPWGCKRGPRSWGWVKELEPTVIVRTHRPVPQLDASRKRWGKKGSTVGILRRADAKLRLIEKHARAPFFHVRTADLVAGNYETVLPAFEALGVVFSETVARNWIEPAIWNRGLRT